MKQVHKGMTLLMVACHEAQRDIVNMLLDMGADINAEGEKGNTALGAALEGKKESIALLLLQRGASPTQLNNKRRSPAHVAAYNNMAEALREIVKRGADVNVKDEFEDAPLHDAIEKDHKEALDVLMEAPRLDLQNRNRKGFNMLQLACLRGNAYAVEKIVQRDRRHINDLMGGEFNALMIAVTNDHVECARLLIAEGNASLDMKGAEGLTALHLSCNEAYPRSVELLLNSGADVNVTSEDGNTPLHLAIGTKSTQLRKNPSERLEQQEHRNRVKIAYMLMEKGAFIDVKNNNGAEPIQCCRPETIRKGFQQFIKENPQLVKRKGGGSGGGGGASLSSSQLQAAMGSLLKGLNLPCGRCQGPSNITVRPCGHKALCRDCCLKVTSCPVCNRFIEQHVATGASGSSGSGAIGDATKEQLQEVCKQS
ncbi:hypothetical protein BaRGS_00012018 [Batillaria attramentaria]|uniref:RING-type domain-containing protein n=1 Tax=Batillaria attramentaria TaxID=370345 RepID=A0ABD0LCV8_9CAEN